MQLANFKLNKVLAKPIFYGTIILFFLLILAIGCDTGQVDRLREQNKKQQEEINNLHQKLARLYTIKTESIVLMVIVAVMASIIIVFGASMLQFKVVTSAMASFFVGVMEQPPAIRAKTHVLSDGSPDYKVENAKVVIEEVEPEEEPDAFQQMAEQVERRYKWKHRMQQRYGPEAAEEMDENLRYRESDQQFEGDGL